MPALNFQKRFAPKVESGEKRHSIRAKRKDGRDPKKGQSLYLYTGMRTKSCRMLRVEICLDSLPITINRSDVVVGGRLLNRVEEYDLAVADGFDSVADFREFFLPSYREEFEGYLIEW